MQQRQDDEGWWHPTSGVGDRFFGYWLRSDAERAERDARNEESARRERQGSSSGSSPMSWKAGVLTCAVVLAVLGVCAGLSVVIFVVVSALGSPG
jgi:hypothetical protein